MKIDFWVHLWLDNEFKGTSQKVYLEIQMHMQIIDTKVFQLFSYKFDSLFALESKTISNWEKIQEKLESGAVVEALTYVASSVNFHSAGRRRAC